MATCETCGRGPASGTTVYRQNDTGQPGRWRCLLHNETKQDPDTLELVTDLEQCLLKTTEQDHVVDPNKMIGGAEGGTP